MARGMIREQVTRSAHAERAQRHRKDACERCGTTVGLQINHRDRDWGNDDPANLETVCGSCHMKGHWQEPGRLFTVVARTCSLCGQPHKGYGYCAYHYQRFKRAGYPANFGG